MTVHSVEVVAALRSVDPRELLAITSTGWLRRFLVLAVHPYASAASVRGVPWYRLGPGAGVGAEVKAPLVWWPHLDDVTFRSFRGELCVRVVGPRVVFGISGTALGGESAQTNAILSDLLRLLAAAVGSFDPPAG